MWWYLLKTPQSVLLQRSHCVAADTERAHWSRRPSLSFRNGGGRRRQSIGTVKTRHHYVRAPRPGVTHWLARRLRTMEWLWITVATCVLTPRSVKGKCWNKQAGGGVEGGGCRAHMGLGAPCTGGSVAWGGEAFNTQNRWVEEYRNPEALAATWSISSKRQRAGKVALKWLILKSNPLLQGSDWWSEYEEGIRHLSKEALNQVLLTPACRVWKALVTTHTISALRTVILLHFNLYALVALFCDMYFGSQGTLVYFF